jgi:hypothetical protein
MPGALCRNGLALGRFPHRWTPVPDLPEGTSSSTETACKEVHLCLRSGGKTDVREHCGWETGEGPAIQPREVYGIILPYRVAPSEEDHVVLEQAMLPKSDHQLVG